MSKSTRAFKILCLLYGKVLRRQAVGRIRLGGGRSRTNGAENRNEGLGQGLEPLEQRVMLTSATPANPNLWPLTLPTITINPTAAGSNGATENAAGIQINPDTAPNTISGTVYTTNASGTQTGEGGVTLFLDEAHTGQYSESDPSTVTAGNGAFTFNSVSSGTYSVDELLPADFSQDPGAVAPTPTLDFVPVSDNQSGSAGAYSGGFTPAQIAHAYGLDQVTFPKLGTFVSGNGAGQTVAIVDAYNNPSIAWDLSEFDQQFGLAAPPNFTVVEQPGTTNASTTNGTNWGVEEALDVEWVHSLAPAANILLVEASSSSSGALFSAADYAEDYPGVSVVSMSFGGTEGSFDSSEDPNFTTPANHSGVTFVASTGDNGEAESYPAVSPYVVAVGGTALTLNSQGNYGSETAWSGSGGGISGYEQQPTYQFNLTSVDSGVNTTTFRSVPDVAFNANPSTGVAIYDTYDSPSSPWGIAGGTSAAAPAWGAIMAIIDQGRILAGEQPLDGATQTLPALYSLPASDFNDITTGSNGYAAGAGFDLVTGLGSPKANLLIPDMVKYNSQQAVEEVANVTVSSSGGGAATFTNQPINVSADVAPTITGVASSTLGGNNWTFTLQGANFGTMSGFSAADTADFVLVDNTNGMVAGDTGDADTINLTSWANGSIQISGLAGNYGTTGNVIASGDSLSLVVVNPQTGLMSAPFTFVANASTPVTAVSSGQPIPDGANSPSAANGTDFGSAIQSASSVTHTFTITNDGTATLTITSNITVPSGYTVTQPLSTSIAAGASTTFTVTLTTGSTSTFAGLVNIPTNDSANNPYTFKITGIVTPTLASTVVSGLGQPIANGATTTSTSNGTNFGTVVQTGQALTRSFTIVNNSGTTLTLGAVSLPSGYTLVSGPATSVAAGGFTTFNVALNSTSAGTFSGAVSFATSDTNNNPFTFNITGTIEPNTPVEALFYNGNAIANGETSPSTTNGTNWGTVAKGTSTDNETFTIDNTGYGTLTINSVGTFSGFSLIGSYPNTIAANSSGTITFGLSTTTPGIYTGDLEINSNDPVNGTYSFEVTGTVNGSTASVTGNGIAISDGSSTTSTSNGTNFGSVAQGATEVEETYTITNSGNATLTVGTPTLPTGFTLVTGPSGSVNVNSSTTFTVGMPTSSPGTFSGNVSFTTNDPANDPYTFAIAGTVTSSTAAKLAFAQQPLGTTAGTVLFPGITVDVENSGGGIVTSNSSSVTLSLNTYPSGATLNGTVTVAAVNGVATFSNIYFKTAGTYTLSATNSTLTSAMSASFAIAPAYTDQTLESFSSTTGASRLGLAMDSHDNLYGVTTTGGTGNVGQIYEVGPGGGFTTLASFNSSTVGIGALVTGSLTIDANGDLFGADGFGGANSDGGIFELPAGGNTITLLASFSSTTNTPSGPLWMDASGNLYGAVEYGGTTGVGSIYELPNGSHSVTVLASFTAGGGYSPQGALAMDGNGNIYGTGEFGGLGNAGIVFELPKNSSVVTALASFDGTNAYDPANGVAIDSSGNLYGIAPGKFSGDSAAIWEVAAGSKAISILSLLPDVQGETEFGNLLLDGNGNLYGTARDGGTGSDGSVFEVPKGSGSVVELEGYTYSSNDSQPYSTLIMDNSGNIYGTSSYGQLGYGTVFKLSAATQLAYSQEPSNAAPGAAITPAVTVAIEDTYGNVIANDNSTVGISIATGTAGAVLGGTTSQAAVNGVATFGNLTINSTGSYTLSASDSPLTSATSTSFNITSSGPAAAISGDGQSIADGESSPSATNATSFGSVGLDGSSVTETYTITNNGNATLTIPSNITVPTGFTVTQPLSTSLAPNAFTTFTVTMPTTVAGTPSGNVDVPTNDPNNNPYLFKITGTVNQGTPAITWATPANITYGTALSATQLDATASYNGSSVAGAFVYTPVAGTVLHAGANQTLSVTFTPTDTTDYTSANDSVLITVNQASPVITWAAPANITYGMALSATQLDATASVGGNLVYTPVSGTVLHAGANQTLSVAFTPTDTTDYTNANDSVLITVNQAIPVITWGAPASITYGMALSTTQLDATASVGGNLVYMPVSGTVLHAGANQTLSVAFTPTDTTDYADANDSVLITVNQATPVITWAAPAGITYGTALSATQLDATASVGGSLVYTPVSGTVLHAGANQTLSVAFTPTDTTDYADANDSVLITVNQATPVITWATPANITYGTALSATQLDATASVGGSLVYTPASGTVLHAGANQTLSVTFTPTDTTDYTNASDSVLISVNQATPVITWAAPASITYGTALSATQLDATAGIGGSFVYTPASGTVLHAGANQTLGVAFTPTDTTDYTNANDSVLITVNQATPVITWAAPASITYGTALSAAQLDATASVGGSLVYTPVSGTVLHAGANQTLSVAFTPTDTTDYTNANHSVLITVNQATPIITWAAPASITYGTALSATQLDATASVGGNFVYTPVSGTVLHAGANQTLSVAFTPTDTTDYTNANDSVLITVYQATPVITWAAPANITYGTALSSSELDATANFNSSPVPGAFVYTPASGTVLAAGANQTLSVAFTPTDATDFTNASDSVLITVTEASTSVSGNGQAIANGESSPSTTNDTNFGSVLQNGSAVTETYTITNNGTATLNITGNVTVPSGFSVTQPLLTSLAPTTSTTFTVSLLTASLGTVSGNVSIPTNDPNNNPYLFKITGTVNAVPVPVASVSGDGNAIADGETSPSSTNATNFGSVALDGAAVGETYTIANTGTATLDITGNITVPAEFSVTQPSSTTLAPNATTTFTVTLATTAAGTFSGNVDIPTNDSNNNPYLFKITGTVNQGTPVITWPTPANITYGSALSATQLDATASYGGSGVAGAFVYTPVAGTVLHAGANQTLSVAFTPTDTTDYTDANDSVLITVNQASPVITWATPANITYGTALSATQLDATASVGGNLVYTPVSGTVLHAGANQTLSVAFTPTDTTDYADANDSVLITVNQASPVITWAAPANITYGTALSATQLDATASVGGNFVYTPASGTVLHAGANQTLSVAFTPTDTTDYTNANHSVLITVNQASPVITWAAPANITYGTTLSATQLDATASVGGNFVYTPASGTVLHAGANQTLSVAFTPTDTTDYTNANHSVLITVNQATPIITWAAPASITYGTALGATQLDATASVGGNFVYTPAAGTVLHAGASQTLSVTFTPTDTTDYTNASDSVLISVNQATPVITWAAPANITYGTALSATQLDATASIGGNFVYTPVSGTVLHAGANQTLSVSFTPTDTTDYTNASDSVLISVNQATPVITWAVPANITYGTALSATQLDATASVGGSLVYTPVSGTVLHAGANQTLSVAFTPTDTTDYADANDSVLITVNQASPVITWAAPANITYGTALSATQLDASANFNSSPVPGAFVYTPASGTVLAAGANQTLSVAFTPTDATDFTNASDSVLITVTEASTSVSGNGQAIANGESSPSTTNDTNFGSVLQNGSAVTETYTITNNGTATLNITGNVTVPSGFSVTQPLLTSLAPTTSTTFTVSLLTASLGTVSGNVSIPTNDPNNNPYLFKITGTVNAVPVPVASVSGDANAIADGETSPFTTNATNFGSVALDGAAVGETYTIANTGTATLDITGNITVPAEFSVTQPSSTTLAPNATTTFTVTLATTAAGTFSGNVNIPTNDPNNNPYLFKITGTVNPGTPVITWAAPANITYGTALSATQLDATASYGGSGVAGAFVYTPASGTVLHAGASQTLGVTFTPTDTTDYTDANDSVLITVNQATPVITWAVPANITYGTALSATQLDATASVGGNFVYTPAAGTVMHAGANQTLSVAFTPTDTTDYTDANDSVLITVNQATPVITWAVPANITYGTTLSATQLDATASVGGNFVYTPVSGTVLHAGANQTLSVAFTPTDSTDYTDANDSVLITVNLAAPVITWAAPANITYGTALGATQLDATASAGGSLVYTPVSGTVLHAGANQTLSVAFTPTDTTDYTNANHSVLITVNQATPVITWATPANITYGTALSATQLDATANVSGNFVYTPASGTVLHAGVNQTLGVAFTPTDTTDYTNANDSVLITVTAASVAVSGDGQVIADGESSPTTTNATDFGTVIEGSATVTETYTITNNGAATLNITGSVTAPTGFTITQPLSASLAPTASTTFTVSLPTGSLGTFSGNVSIPTNDPNNNPYLFKITGTISSNVAPAASISGDGQTIADGSTNPSSANGTNLGSATQGGPSIIQTYTITNNGAGTLNITGAITAPMGYAVTQPSLTSLAAGNSTTFTVTLPTNNLGTFAGIVSVPSNDPSNNPYTFKITANVTVPAGSGVYLSALPFLGTPLNGSGPVMRNVSDGGSGGNPLTLKGVIYPLGLGVQAYSSTTFALDGQFSTFESYVGIDDEVAHHKGAVYFQVWGDGKELYASPLVTAATPTISINVSVAGVKDLTLIVLQAGANNTFDDADWAEARVVPSVAPAAPSNLNGVVVSASQIDLSWALADYLDTDVVVYRSTDNVNFSPLITLPAGSTSYDDTGLNGSTTYYYYADALNGTGASANSNTATATTPSAVYANEVIYLSNLPFLGIPVNGGGPVELNQSTGSGDGTHTNPITLNGVVYPKGLGVQAYSSVSYALNSQFSTFESYIGIDDEVIPHTGSVYFQIWGDGVQLYASPLVTASTPTIAINVNVVGVKVLTLVVTQGGSANTYDHADWADALLLANVLPAAPANLKATAVSSSKINLAWTLADYLDASLQVYRSTDDVNFLPIATLGAGTTSYSDTGLSASTTYDYYVESIDDLGPSESNVASATTRPIGPVAAPVSLSSLPLVGTPQIAGGSVMPNVTAGAGVGNPAVSNPLTLKGVVYPQGLGVQAYSSLTFALNGQYQTFESAIGLDDEVARDSGSVYFQVWGDGVELYSSPLVTAATPTILVNVDVSGVQQLTLIVVQGGATNAFDRADWAGAVLVPA